jgi:hypothetical protein
VAPGTTTITQRVKERADGGGDHHERRRRLGHAQLGGPSIVQGASVQLSATIRDVNGTSSPIE